MDIIKKTVREIRSFNRFYTVNMGFLESNYSKTPYSIAEVRVLFEIWTNKSCVQNDIVKTLSIDKSYLSRILKRFEKNGLIQKNNTENDKRASTVHLTDSGIYEVKKLIEMTNSQIGKQIEGLSHSECEELCRSLHTVMILMERKNKR